MTELQTLKELSWHWINTPEGSTAGYAACATAELREEAINWIKELRLREAKYPCCEHETPAYEFKEFTDTCIEYWEISFVIDWIKNFFNITEKELK